MTSLFSPNLSGDAPGFMNTGPSPLASREPTDTFAPFSGRRRRLPPRSDSFPVIFAAVSIATLPGAVCPPIPTALVRANLPELCPTEASA